MILTKDTPVRHFSHMDLDGIGCGVLARAFFKDVNTTYCGYNTIVSRVENSLKSSSRSALLITDISIPLDLAEQINRMNCGAAIYDHHQTSAPLKKFPWVTLSVEAPSATEVFYGALVKQGFDPQGHFALFVRAVSGWDSWSWAKDNRKVCSDLNDLCNLYDPWEFVRRFSNNPSLVFTSTEWFGINATIRKREFYIQNAMKRTHGGTFVYTDEKGLKRAYKAVFVLAEEYTAYLSDRIIKEMSPDLAVIINVGGTRVSFVSRNPDIDCSKIAERWGGGGHRGAAGAQFPSEKANAIISQFFPDVRMK